MLSGTSCEKSSLRHEGCVQHPTQQNNARLSDRLRTHRATCDCTIRSFAPSRCVRIQGHKYQSRGPSVYAVAIPLACSMHQLSPPVLHPRHHPPPAATATIIAILGSLAEEERVSRGGLPSPLDPTNPFLYCGCPENPLFLHPPEGSLLEGSVGCGPARVCRQ